MIAEYLAKPNLTFQSGILEWLENLKDIRAEWVCMGDFPTEKPNTLILNNLIDPIKVPRAYIDFEDVENLINPRISKFLRDREPFKKAMELIKLYRSCYEKGLISFDQKTIQKRLDQQTKSYPMVQH